MNVLIVEDGFEYIDTFDRFLPDIEWTRAGDGPDALARLKIDPFDAIFLDMRFDRVEEGKLLGDPAIIAEQFNGDLEQARRYLEDHQGNFVLAALREAGCALPVLMSYDFSEEPRRWERIVKRYSPVLYLADNAGPPDVRAALERLTAYGA
jgi:hypothetical protein